MERTTLAEEDGATDFPTSTGEEGINPVSYGVAEGTTLFPDDLFEHARERAPMLRSKRK
jgi:hypothetical protein